MNENEQEKETPETNTEVTAETSNKEEVTKPEVSKETQSALAQKEHFREKFEKAELERKALEDKLNKEIQSKGGKGLDVEEYLDISTSLEGLDQREKEYLAKQHKLTGSSLTEIRASEDFQFWDSAYKQKLEKDLALKPSGTQTETDKPRSFMEEISKASLADKEKLLTEAGYYKPNRPRSDRVDIGGKK